MTLALTENKEAGYKSGLLEASIPDNPNKVYDEINFDGIKK